MKKINHSEDVKKINLTYYKFQKGLKKLVKNKNFQQKNR